jgi:hypothetical protein
LLSEIHNERRNDRWAAAQIKLAKDDRTAARRRADQAAAEQRAAARKDARKLARAVWFRQLPDRAMSALWATMIVLPVALAWQAQAAFAASTLGFASPWHHLFPASVEVAAWLCAFESIRRVRGGGSAGLLPTYMWVLAGSAAVINGAHGWRDGGPVAGLSLAVLSVLGVFLHHIRQNLDAARATGGRSHLVLWRRLRYPRLSIAAASLRAARDDLTPAAAWQLAWEDRYGVGPDAGRRERRIARKVVRHDARQGRKAAKAGDVTIVNGRVHQGFAPIVQEHIDHEREAAVEQLRQMTEGVQDALTAVATIFGPGAFGPDETAANPVPEQGRELSARARELLPSLRAAIEAGEIKPNPKVQPIRRWAKDEMGEPGLGVPVAQELRDAVRDLHAVRPDNEDQADKAVDEIREVSA